MSTYAQGHLWRRITGGPTLAEISRQISIPAQVDSWLQNPVPQTTYPTLPFAFEGGKRLTGAQVAEQLQIWNQWLINQKLQAINPLHESMVDLWRDHLVVSIGKAGVGLATLTDYESRLRTFALGDYRDLLWSVTTSPAMLKYLDNDRNRRDKLNENFSREVMELFTIGPGNYSEQDIKEGARALTGWRVINAKNTAVSATSVFEAPRHDPGIKTYLGRQGPLKPEDVVDILANHVGTGRTLARKIWSRFVYPNPEPVIIERLSQVYLSSQRSIAALVSAVLTSPEFQSPRAYRSRVKSPQEFLLGSLRSLGIDYNANKVFQSLRVMGHQPYRAPSVKGWPETWVTSTSLLNRLSLAQQLTQDYGDESTFRFYPERFTPEVISMLLLDGQVPARLAATIQSLNLRNQVAVILASPIYQLT